MPRDRCRSGRHLASERRYPASGIPYCDGCRVLERHARNIAKPVDTSAWDAERQAWLAAWQAEVGEIIARIRADEGIYGGRSWQTLGEFLPGPAPVRRQGRCDDC